MAGRAVVGPRWLRLRGRWIRSLVLIMALLSLLIYLLQGWLGNSGAHQTGATQPEPRSKPRLLLLGADTSLGTFLAAQLEPSSLVDCIALDQNGQANARSVLSGNRSTCQDVPIVEDCTSLAVWSPLRQLAAAASLIVFTLRPSTASAQTGASAPIHDVHRNIGCLQRLLLTLPVPSPRVLVLAPPLVPLEVVQGVHTLCHLYEHCTLALLDEVPDLYPADDGLFPLIRRALRHELWRPADWPYFEAPWRHLLDGSRLRAWLTDVAAHDAAPLPSIVAEEVWHLLWDIRQLRISATKHPWPLVELVRAVEVAGCAAEPAARRALLAMAANADKDASSSQQALAGKALASSPDFEIDTQLDLSLAASSLEPMLHRVCQRGKSDAVLTTYLTSVADPQHRIRRHPDQYGYMRGWHLSLVQLNLNGIIFHDELGSNFVSSLQPSGMNFVRMSVGSRSTNDARFYAYLDHLRAHPSLSRVLMTDASDVILQADPFDLMSSVNDDVLFVGHDNDLFDSMRSMPWLRASLQECDMHARLPDLEDVLDRPLMFNAGVFGGHRTVVLEFLARMVSVLDELPPDVNCNMAAFNYVIHKHFMERLYTGYPFTSHFWLHEQAPRGVYVLHK
ncbi:uncharacterized protein MONBRDRAFT_31460 [Monosiga brevicollis MX1]|uniref:Uncharacterized protein n=1 Tax=Monosiga brevicollis TaxID=81824 RepID=A9UTA7_MONBE|nr:uncharacterized protein MONBRDRAFT_31460 [Monosiga brevicollis MX1]EDQ91461.1 predicted protein [Monosiga brevicollis MX1]|eukprot:XP_001743883.1 hypothetical protein [Monosiga brevicollis MX1]